VHAPRSEKGWLVFTQPTIQEKGKEDGKSNYFEILRIIIIKRTERMKRELKKVKRNMKEIGKEITKNGKSNADHY